MVCAKTTPIVIFIITINPYIITKKSNASIKKEQKMGKCRILINFALRASDVVGPAVIGSKLSDVIPKGYSPEPIRVIVKTYKTIGQNL